MAAHYQSLAAGGVARATATTVRRVKPPSRTTTISRMPTWRRTRRSFEGRASRRETSWRSGSSARRQQSRATWRSYEHGR
eukprot:2058518-Prymnesium_polylepis.1